MGVGVGHSRRERAFYDLHRPAVCDGAVNKAIAACAYAQHRA